MTFQAGDRIRWQTIGDDGLPLVRYGFVGGVNGSGERVVVMLDGELKGDRVVDQGQLEPVMITNVQLCLHGADLLDDPSLRQGLVNLWWAEADQAGLEVRSLTCLGTGVRDVTGDGFALAELQSGGHHYVLRAERDALSDTVQVHADAPRRWES